jgi:hypothetical protein
MSRHTLLDLLGTDALPGETEKSFVEFCIWQQAYPAFQQILTAAGLAEYVLEAREAKTISAMKACADRAANTAKTADDMPVLVLAAVQGMASEIEQIAASADLKDGDSSAVSFHAARLVGWASWASNNFSTGVFKSSAEDVAYGEQLQELMRLFGVAGV